jgi:hypothetical protein
LGGARLTYKWTASIGRASVSASEADAGEPISQSTFDRPSTAFVSKPIFLPLRSPTRRATRPALASWTSCRCRSGLCNHLPTTWSLNLQHGPPAPGSRSLAPARPMRCPLTLLVGFLLTGTASRTQPIRAGSWPLVRQGIVVSSCSFAQGYFRACRGG